MKKPAGIAIPFLLLWSLVVLVACQSTKSGTSNVLRFNLHKGKTYKYEIVADLDQSIMGQSTKTTLLTSYAVSVVSENGTTKTLCFTYNDLKLDMNMMGTELHVDSEKPVNELEAVDPQEKPMAMFNKVFKAMMGKKFFVDVNEEGKVTKVSGLEDFAAAIVDSLHLPAEMRESILQSTKQQFNSGDVENQIMPIFYIFPNKPVQVGDSWVKSYELTGKMAAKNSATYTVKQIDANLVTLGVENKVSSLGGEI